MKPIHPPPPDQVIVDDYFRLSTDKKLSSVCWLYGMLATYGLKPKELKGFTWNLDQSINVNSKKKKVKPVHPQWCLLFQLKEKQPSDIEDCFDKLEFKLSKAIANQKFSLNFTDLQLAYRIRKDFYQPKKECLQTQSPFSEVLCAR